MKFKKWLELSTPVSANILLPNKIDVEGETLGKCLQDDSYTIKNRRVRFWWQIMNEWNDNSP